MEKNKTVMNLRACVLFDIVMLRTEASTPRPCFSCGTIGVHLLPVCLDCVSRCETDGEEIWTIEDPQKRVPYNGYRNAAMLLLATLWEHQRASDLQLN